MVTHRPGIRLPDQMTDRGAASRFGVDPPRDFDQGEKYDGEAALWPPGSLDMDPARHEAAGCWPALRTEQDGSLFAVSCRNCHGTFRAATEAEAMRKARRAHGDA